MFETREKSNFSTTLDDIVIFLTICIATIANFADFGFTLQGINRITAVSLMIYIVTTVTYNHCYNKGKLSGKLDEKYKATLIDYTKEVDSVVAENLLVKIPDFISYYIKNDLIEYRKGILFQFDIEYEEYEKKYLRLSNRDIMKLKVSIKMKKALIKCNMAKPASITKADIISCDNDIKRKRPLGLSGHKMEQIDKTSQGLYRLFMTIFAGTIGVDIVFNFTWITVVLWAVRMMPTLTALVMGNWRGYTNIVETETCFKQNQIYMIKLLKEWNANNNPKGIEQRNDIKVDKSK